MRGKRQVCTPENPLFSSRLFSSLSPFPFTHIASLLFFQVEKGGSCIVILLACVFSLPPSFLGPEGRHRQHHGKITCECITRLPRPLNPALRYLSYISFSPPTPLSVRHKENQTRRRCPPPPSPKLYPLTDLSPVLPAVSMRDVRCSTTNAPWLTNSRPDAV